LQTKALNANILYLKQGVLLMILLKILFSLITLNSSLIVFIALCINVYFMQINKKLFMTIRIKTIQVLFVAFFPFCFPAFSIAQNNEPQIENNIDSVVLQLMSANKIIGLSIGIIKNDSIYFSKGYGTKKINEEAPIDSLTNFLTCSISKLFTATAIMQLYEQGKIDIHKKLTDYIPNFVLKDERYKVITIEQMLTHTSGLPNIFNRNFVQTKNDSLALTLFAKKLYRKKLSFEPGVQLSAKTYSNTAYNILGLVIEKISGQTFSSYIDKNILQPAGMNNSSFFYKKIDESRRSTPHKKNRLTGKVKASSRYPDVIYDKPCGYLNSCSYDLCKWMLHNLSIYNNTIKEKGVLKQNTLTDMWTTKRTIPPYKTSMGLGWWIVNSDKYGKYLFHVGNDPGFSATLIISPENNFGIVVLCNGMYPKDIVWNKVPFEIINLFSNGWKK
jgi:CubicO group peptidase (beta-lactamase class C family)